MDVAVKPKPPIRKRGEQQGLALLSVRDVTAIRVKVLNTTRLHNFLGGYMIGQRDELDRIGAEKDDSRTLLTRTLEILSVIQADPQNEPEVRIEAAKTIVKAITDLRADESEARQTVAKLAQQSQEHADRMAVDMRRLDIIDGKQMNPLENIPLEELKRLRDATQKS